MKPAYFIALPSLSGTIIPPVLCYLAFLALLPGWLAMAAASEAQARSDGAVSDTLAVYDFALPADIAHQTVYSVAIDRRGILYFGTEGGLLEFDSIEWRFIPVRPQVRITHLALNSRGRVFAAGPGELGYLLVDETGGTVYESVSENGPDEGISLVHPQALIPQGPDMLIIDEQEILRYTIQAKTLQRRRPDSGLELEAATFFDNQLFVNDRTRGLLRADVRQLFDTVPASDEAFFELLQPVEGASGLRIRQLQPLNAGTLLLATISEGVLQLQKSQTPERPGYVLSSWENEAEAFFRRYPVSASDRFSDVVAFGSHGGGILLLNADGSLNQRVGREQGLQEAFVFSLSFTTRGRLWTGMNGGASSILAPGLATSPGQHITEMQSRQMSGTDSSAAKSDRSEMIPGAEKSAEPGFVYRGWKAFTGWLTDLFSGYGVITPLDFSDHNADDFTTILRSVRETKTDSLIFRGAFARELYGVQELAQADSVRHIFPAEINAFRFSYATNQFEDADEIRHQVLLEGLDRNWSNWSVNTYREYTNLQFGTYQFRVRSMNPAGETSVESAFRFQIRPPWHQAGWFYTIQLVLIIGMLAISFYLNKTGRAFTVSQFLIYLVIIITFEYVLVYSQPLFHNFTQGIAFFEIALSVVLVICLTPVEEGYRWLLNKLTGFTAEELVARRKAREAEAATTKKKQGFIEQISSKGRLKR